MEGSVYVMQQSASNAYITKQDVKWVQVAGNKIYRISEYTCFHFLNE